MWINSHLSLATLLVIGAGMPLLVRAETTVTTDTRDYDPKLDSDKPTNPRFACTAESASCWASDRYTNLDYLGNLQLASCHEDGWFKGLGRRIFNHSFIDSFWAYCPFKDENCERYLKEYESDLGKVATDLEQSVRDQSGCKPTFKCFKLEDMDKNCFNKN